MSPNAQIWLPPMLSLLGTLIAVVFAAWLSNRFMEAKIDALRAEVKQGFAELRLEFHSALSGFEHRLERVEERLGLVQK